MKDTIRILAIAAALILLYKSGVVCYSAEKPCPRNAEPIGQDQFMSAHGISQENFSLWLQEHSVWRDKYQNDLQNYSYLSEPSDVNRR